MEIRAIWFMPPPIAIVAAADGRYSEQAISIDAVRTRSSDEQFATLVTGERDAAVTAMDNVLAWNLRDGPQDFAIIGQVETTTLLPVIARAEILSLTGLAGRNILVDAPANGFVVALRAMLADAGIGEDGYTLIEVGGVKERLDVLVAGQGDATLLGPPFDAMALAAGFVSLGRINDSYPAFPGQGIVVRKETLQRQRAALSAWLSALEAGRQSIVDKPDAARAALAAEGFAGAAVDTMIAACPPFSLAPDPKGVDLLLAQRRQVGLPGGDVSYDALVDLTVLETPVA